LEDKEKENVVKKVLIIDDDPKLLKMLRRTLTYENFNVITASNGLEALPLVTSESPDLIILDWMMPKMDGITFLEKLRDSNNKTMILMLTARDAVENRVLGLESGADDYLIKPFAPSELVARVHAMLRRVENEPDVQKCSYGGISLDPKTREVLINQQLINLTVTEFDLLHMLLRHPRQVLERQQILNEVWGYDFYGNDNVLEVYIGYLRKKLNIADLGGLIQTVRGVGYVLREEN
jgi:two-component system response regulator MprA